MIDHPLSGENFFLKFQVREVSIPHDHIAGLDEHVFVFDGECAIANTDPYVEDRFVPARVVAAVRTSMNPADPIAWRVITVTVGDGDAEPAE